MTLSISPFLSGPPGLPGEPGFPGTECQTPLQGPLGDEGYEGPAGPPGMNVSNSVYHVYVTVEKSPFYAFFYRSSWNTWCTR